ncbi:MAG: family 16 glycoside hydrolase, partial [Anaerolineales bacterium]
VLYEMLSGEVPFGGETLAAVMNKVLTAPLPDLKSLREEVPDGLIQIVARMLTRETTERYQSIREVAADLERGQPLEGSTVSGKQHPKRKAARVPGKEWRGAMLGRRRLSGPALVIATLIALPLLAVVVMAVFNLCPPTGPWPLPPWCPGSQITWPFNTPAAMATATNSATASSITEGTTGAMLFKDLFDDELSPRWVFEPETWARELAAGRTALHNAPSSEASVAKIENTSWEDYSLQFDFRFLQPGSSGMHYFFVRGRMTNCPPTVEALQSYVLTVTPDQSLLEKEPCRSGTRYKIGSNDRDLAEDEWHSLQMRFVGPRIVVLIDGEEYFDYVDTDEPFDSGNFAIETDHDVEFLIDDVQVNEGIAEIARPSAVPLATEEAPDCPPGMELLFFDDFEDGDMVGWDTGPPGGDEQLASADWGWQVENDDLADNHLLVGVGHYHAWREIVAGAWGDFWAQLRLKRLSEVSAAHIVVDGDDAGRYTMNYPEGYVNRNTGVGEATTLVQAQFPSDTGWHDLQLSVVAGRIRVWLDGVLLADVTDPEPLAPSRLEFENLGTSDSALWYDDVLVCKVNDAAGLTGTDVGINANELTTLEAHTGAVFDLAWLPNGNRSAAWVTSKPVEIWVTP